MVHLLYEVSEAFIKNFVWRNRVKEIQITIHQSKWYSNYFYALETWTIKNLVFGNSSYILEKLVFLSKLVFWVSMKPRIKFILKYFHMIRLLKGNFAHVQISENAKIAAVIKELQNGTKRTQFNLDLF